MQMKSKVVFLLPPHCFYHRLVSYTDRTHKTHSWPYLTFKLLPKYPQIETLLGVQKCVLPRFFWYHLHILCFLCMSFSFLKIILFFFQIRAFHLVQMLLLSHSMIKSNCCMEVCLFLTRLHNSQLFEVLF